MKASLIFLNLTQFLRLWQKFVWFLGNLKPIKIDLKISWPLARIQASALLEFGSPENRKERKMLLYNVSFVRPGVAECWNLIFCTLG